LLIFGSFRFKNLDKWAPLAVCNVEFLRVQHKKSLLWGKARQTSSRAFPAAEVHYGSTISVAKIEMVKNSKMRDSAMIPMVVIIKVKIPQMLNSGVKAIRSADNLHVTEFEFNTVKNTHKFLLVWPLGLCLP
jgi:hypothetical protein